MRFPQRAILSAAAVTTSALFHLVAARAATTGGFAAFAGTLVVPGPGRLAAAGKRTVSALNGEGSGDGSCGAAAAAEENMPQHDEVEAALKADGAGPPTIFDRIISGEIPSEKVYEDDDALAFRDVNPQAPTHILVIPKNRDGLTSLSNAREDQKELLGHLLYVAQDVGKKECPKGFRLVINDGREGAQSVYHLHIHVIGGRQMGWPPG